MKMHVPDTSKKRVVIIGGGFGGLAVANKLDENIFQTVLVDKVNYHQFQPLLYQVVSSGLESGSISFPFRKLFQKKKDFYFRLAEIKSIDIENSSVKTSIGVLSYDYLVIAGGTTTNFYGNTVIEQEANPMKTLEEALMLRNTILMNLEKALNTNDPLEREALLNIVIVGGGATGVEIAGAISEMKRFIVPKDYPDLKVSDLNIYLIEGSGKLLANMSEKASANSKDSLSKMGVKVQLNTKVTGYEEGYVLFEDGGKILTQTLIWVSGVTSNHFEGIPAENIGRGGRIIVNEYNLVKNTDNIYAVGDICLQTEADYPNGHPQVAPVAIQQGKHLAKNLKALYTNKEQTPFKYKNQGTLATIGRNRAVADLHKIHLHGFSAWVVWMFVHLRSILGIKNKIMVLIDWVWSYFSYDRSDRFIMYIPRKRKNKIKK